MGDRQFDDLTRELAAGPSRRGIIRTGLGGLGAALVATLSHDSAEAKKCDDDESRCGRRCCKKNEKCCDNKKCCKPGRKCCDGKCCRPGGRCCEGKCCKPGHVCRRDGGGKRKCRRLT